MKPKDYIKQFNEYNIGYLLKSAFESGFTTATFSKEIETFNELEPLVDLSILGNDIQLFNPTRPQLLNFLKVFGGKWGKTINDYAKDKIDYIQVINGFTLKAIAVLPPAACIIVEEEVLIPATPEQYEKRKVIKCPEPITPEMEVEISNEKN